MIAGTRGLCYGNLAVGVEEFVAAGGHTKIGETYLVPKSSTLVSTLDTSLSLRGSSWNFKNPSRLARSVTSSSMPDAM